MVPLQDFLKNLRSHTKVIVFYPISPNVGDYARVYFAVVTGVTTITSYLRPLSIAKSRQFRPVWSVSVMSAPLDSNRDTTSGCPSLAAKCNGVVCKNKHKFSYKRDRIQSSYVRTYQIESKLQNATSIRFEDENDYDFEI